jgi:predicted lipid carrier protein YhbT
VCRSADLIERKEKGESAMATTEFRRERVLQADRPTRVEGLLGVTGRVRVDIGDRLLGVLEVEDGNVILRPGARDADAVVIVTDPNDFKGLVSGHLNPVVAALQGRLTVEGDTEMAIRVILGLQRTAI